MLLKLLSLLQKHSKAPKSKMSWGDEFLVWIIIIIVLTWLN